LIGELEMGRRSSYLVNGKKSNRRIHRQK